MKRINKKSERILQVEEKFGVNIEELLRKLYVDEGKTSRVIAQEIGVAYMTVQKWLPRAGIYSHKLKSLEEGGNES